jgi:5-methylcytosine-specific restriction endonuclease McrA
MPACEVCSSPFERNRGRSRACSRVCGFELQRRDRTSNPATWSRSSMIHWWMRACRQCGVSFIAKTKGALMCSVLCRAARVAGRVAKGYTPVSRIEKRCAECAAIFPGRERDAYCSNRCSTRVKARSCNSRRRARKSGYAIMSEVIRFGPLWDRDLGRCYICGQSCNRSLKAPSPLAPTVDHKVPLSAGGSHLMENAGIAHFVCNTINSNMFLSGAIREACLDAVLAVKNGLRVRWTVAA